MRRVCDVLSGAVMAQALPDYCPPEYDQIVEQSKSEDGLLIYSAMAAFN